MGIYLNPGCSGFSMIRNDTYVDKSRMIALINRVIDTPRKLLCVSRPRRFGKSFAAKMLCAYYDKSCDSSKLFDDLKIAGDSSYLRHKNQYNVLYLDIAGMMNEARGGDLVDSIRDAITKEVTHRWPMLHTTSGFIGMLADAAVLDGSKFIAIIDEWDAPVRETPNDCRPYLEFLRALFKNSGTTDKTFAGAYMTGILPIKKGPSESALSDFYEYTMLAPYPFGEYAGFTSDEVRALCTDYNLDFESMRFWYDGYRLGSCPSIYNPNSVMKAIWNRRFDSYWRQSTAANNLLRYIEMDFDGLQKAAAELLGGVDVRIDSSGFQNDTQNIFTKDDALTLLVHLGYLSYDEDAGTVRIPNEEIRLEFAKTVRLLPYTETMERVRRSVQLISDTVAMDEDAVATEIERIHTEETAPLFYNNEQSLRSVIKLAYFSYKDHYIKLEELSSGNGCADIVYLPKKDSPYPALLVELKWDHSADSAIAQIKKKQYPAALKNYGGELLLVGISYSRDGKENERRHHCRIERASF